MLDDIMLFGLNLWNVDLRNFLFIDEFIIIIWVYKYEGKIWNFSNNDIYGK